MSRSWLAEDLPGFLRDHRTVLFQPGSQGTYRSVDTALLGEIVRRVEGKPLATLLAERLWQPVGAEQDATWNLDHENGVEKAFCCVNAIARDYARIGQLVLDNGRVGDKQVVPAAWITRISQPVATPVDHLGYSAQWWHPIGDTDGDFSAVGIYGQFTYVNPKHRIVIVKLSDHGQDQDEAETIDVMRAIAQA